MTTTTTGGRRPAAGEPDTAARIRTTAVELFARHGYEGTSLRQVAEVLGVTKAALYYHYPSKEDILVAVLEPIVVETQELLGRLGVGGGPASQRRALGDYLDLLLRHRQLITWMMADSAALADSPAGARLAPLGTRLQEAIVGVDAPLQQRVRIAAAVGAMRAAVIGFPTCPDADLRGPALAAGLGALRGRSHGDGSRAA